MQTLVSTSRLKDFELMLNQIGNYVISSTNTPPLGMLDVSSPSSVSKEDYLELYLKIGGADDPTDPNKFQLPVLAPLPTGQKYYLVGKVIYSNTFLSNSTVTTTFGPEDLDSGGYFQFNHGINHTNPLIQIKDPQGGIVLPTRSLSNLGSTKVLIGTVIGTHTITAVG